MRSRLAARIIPPRPITAAIVRSDGAPLAYGVIADISESGACVLTDARLTANVTLDLRISFAHPPELCEATAFVVWAKDCLPTSGGHARRYGIQWVGATLPCRHRCRDLAARALPPPRRDQYPFQTRWIVAEV